ncbi:MAG TPA: FHA domain-containing protein, partial [Kofleriaceae bacterium]|nr:FHA domain-containing protein [Kofleriaceae bacterium]
MRSGDEPHPFASEETVTVVPGRPLAAALAALDREDLTVLVLSPSFLAIYRLPESGEITIGRSSLVELYVDDPLVSRRHAIL